MVVLVIDGGDIDTGKGEGHPSIAAHFTAQVPFRTPWSSWSASPAGGTSRSRRTPTSHERSTQFAVCLNNSGNEASLSVGKIYAVLPDAKAAKDELTVANTDRH